MPANITHILIANKARNLLPDIDNDASELISYRPQHFYLGSIGPDLPSYKTSQLVREALDQLLVRPFVSERVPKEEDASYFLHSTRPHLFPFYLMETNLAYADIRNGEVEINEFNRAVFSFALGFVCHLASDQIIHRLVSSIVGPYYRSIEIAQNHSDCEVHQDIFLFYELYKNRTFDKTVQKELINIDKFGFDYDQFCNMISLAISKAGYTRISQSDIEGWVNGINLTFNLMDDIGPYVNALEHYEEYKNNLDESSKYKQYFKNSAIDFDYMTYFHRAVNLSAKYMSEIIRLWNEKDFSYQSLEKYQSVIQSDDLTSPIRIVDEALN